MINRLLHGFYFDAYLDRKVLTKMDPDRVDTDPKRIPLKLACKAVWHKSDNKTEQREKAAGEGLFVKVNDRILLEEQQKEDARKLKEKKKELSRRMQNMGEVEEEQPEGELQQVQNNEGMVEVQEVVKKQKPAHVEKIMLEKPTKVQLPTLEQFYKTFKLGTQVLIQMIDLLRLAHLQSKMKVANFPLDIQTWMKR